MSTPNNAVEELKTQYQKENAQRDERVKNIKIRIDELEKVITTDPRILLFKREAESLSFHEKEAKENARSYYLNIVEELDALKNEDKLTLSYMISKRLNGGYTNEQSEHLQKLEKADQESAQAIKFQNEINKLTALGLSETVSIAYLTNNQKENR